MKMVEGERAHREEGVVVMPGSLAFARQEAAAFSLQVAAAP